ncbi:hypothetical protein LTR28_012654, partial [Elasticomyces elasticus]
MNGFDPSTMSYMPGSHLSLPNVTTPDAFSGMLMAMSGPQPSFDVDTFAGYALLIPRI